MSKPIVVRQHIISLVPDVLLFLAGIALFLEVPGIDSRMPMIQARALSRLCEGLGVLLIAVGLGHFLWWWGFRLEIASRAITIRRYFFFKKSFSLFRSDVSISASQSRLDAWFDKGTLVIYVPGGEILTLNHLADFSRFIPRLPLRPA